MKQVKVQGAPLIRDISSNALISCDINGLHDYQKKRRLFENQKNEIVNIKSDINELKKDISDIKNLLISLSKTI